MKLNRIPSWLKGGIILLAINLVLILPFVIYVNVGLNLTEGTIMELLYLPSFLTTDALYWGSNSKTAVFIFSSIFYFIVGVIIGGIVGKIKNKFLESSETTR